MDNKILKSSLNLFTIGLIITIIFWFIGQNRMTWLQFINVASMVGLAYIVIGGAMYVYYGGFFRGISYSFRNFFKSARGDGWNIFTSKGEAYAEELSKSMDEYDRPNQKKKLLEDPEFKPLRRRPPIAWAFIINALIFFLGSLLLAILLY